MDHNAPLAESVGRPGEHLAGTDLRDLFEPCGEEMLGRIEADVRTLGTAKAELKLRAGPRVTVWAWPAHRKSIWCWVETEAEYELPKPAESSGIRDRDVLLEEVHHRVKNNLQIISSLLSTQMGRVVEPAALEALKECQARVLAIALIHQKLQQSPTYTDVRLAEYIRGLGAMVLRATGMAGGAVRLEFELDDLTLGVDQAVSCGLILNELLTNALKHAFPEDKPGVVRIALRWLPTREVFFSVSDDGAGLPAELVPETATTMGLQLVTTLCEQLDARVTVDRSAGTSFAITFVPTVPYSGASGTTSR